MYTKVFSSERWRRWHGFIKYPFYHHEFMANTFLPCHIYESMDLRLDFYSCCEHWFDCCLNNNIFEMQKDLPYSGGGFGLICSQDTHTQELYENLFGVLEFVEKKLFDYLSKNGYPSLYKSKEGDLCIMFGPLSLCNNGRNQLINHYPSFIDRDMLTDEELMYCSSRKQFTNVTTVALGADLLVVPPTDSVLILFEHFALRMHVTNNIFILQGEQIFVDYGHLTAVGNNN
jgi:hypothetical protein